MLSDPLKYFLDSLESYFKSKNSYNEQVVEGTVELSTKIMLDQSREDVRFWLSEIIKDQTDGWVD